MNNKALWVVLVLIVLAILAYFLFGTGNDDAAQQQTNNNQQQVPAAPQDEADEPSTQSTSIKALMGKGNQQCTYAYTDAQSKATVSGTVYVSGGKVRMDSTSTVSGQAMVMHAIMMDNTYYTWTEGQTAYAMKMKFDPATGQAAGGTGSDDGQGVNWEQQYNYGCKGWSPDQAKFTLPAGVTFMDLAELGNMPNGMQ